MSIINQNPRSRETSENLSKRLTAINAPVITVAAMKFDRPQSTFVLGLDLWPNGLRKIVPAAPYTK